MLRFAFKPRHPVTRVAFTADGREVVTAQPFTGIAVRDRLTGEARLTFPLLNAAAIYALASHPIRGWIAFRYVRGAALLDPVSGCEVEQTEPTGGTYHRLRPELLQPFGLWWRGKEQVVLSVRMRTTPLVTLSDPRRTATVNSPIRLRRRFDREGLVVYSPDGTKLALGDGETLGVFDLTPLETATKGKSLTIYPLFTLERPDPTTHGTFADKQAEHWLPPVAFDHAGRSMFTLGLRNRVQRIDLATGGVMAEWGWRCEPIRSLAVSPDDLTAAAGCQRGELVLWDLE